MAIEQTQTTPSRPNFFIILGLDPDEPWNQATFKQVMGEKQRAWSVQRNNVAKVALQAKQYMEYIPQIWAVMEDEHLREQEAAQARLIRAQQHDEKIREFEKQLSFINAKDAIEERELNTFIDDFQGIYSADEIRKRVTVKTVSPGARKEEDNQFLDASIAKNITDLLGIVKKASLYEVLGLPDATATPQLREAASNLYNDMNRRMSKTADVTALAQLAGLAETIFQSEDMRQRYDASLRRASLDVLLVDLDEVMKRAVTKEVQAGQVRLFLENAEKAGWKREEAYNRLRQHAVQRKWSLAPTEVEARIRCRNCSRLNARDRTLCADCGQLLYDTCPDCGQQNPSEDRICNNCGFAVGNRYMVDSRLDELEQLCKAGDYEQARNVLRVVEDAWKPKKADERLKRINDYHSHIARHEEQQRQAQKDKETQLQLLITQKRLIEATTYIRKHGADIPNGEEVQRSLDQRINLARNEVRIMRTMRNMPPDEKITRVRRAGDICKDLPDLDDFKLPPSPPTNLRVQVRGTTVSLAWDPSTTPNVFYTIVCKPQAQPNTITDGKEIASNITGTTCDDAAARIGVPLYYAVYSGYDTVKSTQAALLAQPVMVVQSILSVTARVDDQLVELDWETPPNAYSVVVVRNEQAPPSSIDDGSRVGEYRTSQKRLTDRHVQNGQTYYYALYAQFKDHEGRLIAAPGEIISVTPDTPPQLIQHLDIKSTRLDQGYEVVIGWQRPNKGRAIIMKSEKTFALAAGQVISQVDLIKYGEKLEQAPDAVTEKWAKAGVAYYTPVVVFQGMAYIGASQRFVCVDNISNVRYQNIGTSIRFLWRWPANCQEVLITYSLEGWPRPNDPNAVTRRVSFTEYDRMGYYDLRGTVDQDYYIVISGVIIVDNTRITSEGIRVFRQANTLEFTYEIRNPTRMRRKRTLHITARTPGTLPRLMLVGRRDRLPFKKADGDLLQHIGPIVMQERECVVDLPERAYPARTFGKLFLEDESLNATVIIRHPDENKLRLS